MKRIGDFCADIYLLVRSNPASVRLDVAVILLFGLLVVGATDEPTLLDVSTPIFGAALYLLLTGISASIGRRVVLFRIASDPARKETWTIVSQAVDECIKASRALDDNLLTAQQKEQVLDHLLRVHRFVTTVEASLGVDGKPNPYAYLDANRLVSEIRLIAEEIAGMDRRTDQAA